MKLKNRRKVLLIGSAACIWTLLTCFIAQARQIEVWSYSMGSQDEQWMQTVLLPRFLKERRIDVVFKRIQSREMYEQLAQKQGPDVLITSGSGIALGADGTLMPLSQLLNRWNDRKFISPNLMTYDTKTKNLYTLPIGVSFWGVSYNKQAYSKVGLSLTSLPSSWEALRAAAQKTILLWQGRIVRTGIETNWDFNSWQALMLQLGETGLSPDYRHSQIGSAKAVEALNYMAGLHQLGYPPEREIFGEEGRSGAAQTKFPDGMTAMGFANTSLAFSTQAKNTRWQQEYGFFALRRYPSLQPVAMASKRSIGITTWTRDPQAAWEFITWLFTPDVQVLYNSQVHYIPTRTDLATQVAKIMPVAASCYAALKYAQLLPEDMTAIPLNRDNYRIYQDNFRQVLKGKLDAGSFLYQMQGEVQSSIDDYWQQLESGVETGAVM